MSAITQCPQCGTRFKVSHAQMETHQGMVRCGRCQEVFNAKLHLHDDQPSPQLSLPILDEDAEWHPPAKTADEHQTEVAQPVPFTPFKQAEHFFVLKVADEISEQTIEQDRRWPQVMAALLLFLILLAQMLYFFRIEIAARIPGLKPALVAGCKLLQCSIPLPNKAEQMSIESSELAASPVQANAITLNAILRNNAPYVQAYPMLELTLTDTTDQALARRIFLPQDYLKPGQDEKQGLASNRETSVKLHLDTNNLKANGYRLLLFYPSNRS